MSSAGTPLPFDGTRSGRHECARSAIRLDLVGQTARRGVRLRSDRGATSSRTRSTRREPEVLSSSSAGHARDQAHVLDESPRSPAGAPSPGPRGRKAHNRNGWSVSLPAGSRRTPRHGNQAAPGRSRGRPPSVVNSELVSDLRDPWRRTRGALARRPGGFMIAERVPGLGWWPTRRIRRTSWIPARGRGSGRVAHSPRRAGIVCNVNATTPAAGHRGPGSVPARLSDDRRPTESATRRRSSPRDRDQAEKMIADGVDQGRDGCPDPGPPCGVHWPGAERSIAIQPTRTP